MNGHLLWKTVSVYVDVDTGELLQKGFALKHYTIIKKTKKHERKKHNSASGTTTITNICRKRDRIQQTLF